MKKTLVKFKDIVLKPFSILADCIVPTLPILIGVGMLKVVLIVFGPQVLKILTETSDTYIVLSFIADAGFYFMPIYIAVAAAEYFNTNKYIAALIGAVLISPSFVEIINANNAITIFGLPIALTNYSNQIIPSIISTWIMSYIYNFLDEKLNSNIKPIFISLVTILIMMPIVLCAIGPISVILSDKVTQFIIWLSTIGPFGNGIMCAIIPYIVILGLAGADLSAMIALASTGCDPILLFSNILFNSILGFVVFAIYLKDKKADTLVAAITSTFAGTSEPALLGIVIRDSKALFALTLADFVAGLYSGIAGVKTFAMSSFGILGIFATIGPESSILHAAIALIIGCIVGFIISYLLHKNKQA